MKFCCVTPCFNAEKYIADTMESILQQRILLDGANSIHYIIRDGGSSDSTVDIARNIFSRYEGKENFILEVVSEEDDGMYDALSSGFKSLQSGDVYGYLNAGDYYSPYAIEIVWEIMGKHGADFLTGMEVIYNEGNHITGVSFPFFYPKGLVRCGLYGRVLPFIQQESTFWNHEMHQRIDFDALSKFRLAGDYFIWRSMIEFVNLDIVYAHLGGFKIHRGQLSEGHLAEYLEELKMVVETPSFLDYIGAYLLYFGWKFLTPGVKKRLNTKIYSFDHSRAEYRRLSDQVSLTNH